MKHEKEIDLTLKDMKNKAMVMGMQYIKQAIQALQNLALDMYKKVIFQYQACTYLRLCCRTACGNWEYFLSTNYSFFMCSSFVVVTSTSRHVIVLCRWSRPTI